MKGQIPEAINAYAGTLEPLSQDVRKKCLTLRERQHNEVFLMLLEKGLLPALKDNVGSSLEELTLKQQMNQPILDELCNIITELDSEYLISPIAESMVSALRKSDGRLRYFFNLAWFSVFPNAKFKAVNEIFDLSIVCTRSDSANLDRTVSLGLFLATVDWLFSEQTLLV
jgi:hypothetical protein